MRRLAVLAPPFAWLALFLGLPTLIVLAISVAQSTSGAPPIAPLLDETGGWAGTLEAYALIAGDGLYRLAYWNSIRLAAEATLLCLALGYPMALAIAGAPKRTQPVLLLLVMLPFWTSFLIRVYAWIGILKDAGLLNQALLALGVIDAPLQILQTDAAVLVGMVYGYLPFMVLPIYTQLEKRDLALEEAAADLGARPFTRFHTVTWPLSLPGVLAGALLVFVPASGEFVIPELLGAPTTPMIGTVLWTEFFTNRDWPTAAALAIVLLIVLVAPILVVQAAEARSRREGAA